MEDALGKALGLVDTGGKLFDFWFPRFWKRWRLYDEVPEMTGICLAALIGNKNILDQFLNHQHGDPDAKEEGRTALY